MWDQITLAISQTTGEKFILPSQCKIRQVAREKNGSTRKTEK